MFNPYMPAEAKILDIKSQTKDTLTYTMAIKDARLQRNYLFLPGQFNMVHLPGIGEAPISLSSDTRCCHEYFEHTIREVGSVTGNLAKLKQNDIVGIRGPYGSGWPVEKEAKGKNLIIIAGGIGLAPLRPVITYVLQNKEKYKKVEILYGARTFQDMLFKDEFEIWAGALNTTLLLTVDKAGEEGRPVNVGNVTTLFDKMKISPKDTLVLICGPEIMMHFVVLGLLQRGFFSYQIYVSLERRMHCGIGKCGHCQIGSKFVCVDGPVFPYSDIYGLIDMNV